MYTKNDGWIYFESNEEYIDFIKNKDRGSGAIYEFFFGDDEPGHRRQMTSDFKARTEFKVGDKVCWCGCNGEVVNGYFRTQKYPIIASFEGTVHSFTQDGKQSEFHKLPSLFHGHDVLRAEDQKFPVERVENKRYEDRMKEATEELIKGFTAYHSGGEMNKIEIKIACGTTIDLLEDDANKIANIAPNKSKEEIKKFQVPVQKEFWFQPAGPVSYENGCYQLVMMRRI